jgi:carbonic anhydrase
MTYQSEPHTALAALRAGNDRFVAGAATHPHQDAERRAAVADAQAPFAAIFGCSDSRIAAEIIFDQGLGDLFVVRTAGHTIGPQVLGSLEYAVSVLRTPLVVVLGHHSCGAVQVARDAVRHGQVLSRHVRSVVDAIVPSVLRASRQNIDDVDRIVEMHIQGTVNQLLRYPEALADAVAAGRCAVVGMSYQLSSGRVRPVAATTRHAVPRPQRGAHAGNDRHQVGKGSANP